MAKEKKRGFFSWLGFGQKEQAQETETEQKVEEQQAVAEEIRRLKPLLSRARRKQTRRRLPKTSSK